MRRRWTADRCMFYVGTGISHRRKYFFFFVLHSSPPTPVRLSPRFIPVNFWCTYSGILLYKFSQKKDDTNAHTQCYASMLRATCQRSHMLCHVSVICPCEWEFLSCCDVHLHIYQLCVQLTCRFIPKKKKMLNYKKWWFRPSMPTYLTYNIMYVLHSMYGISRRNQFFCVSTWLHSMKLRRDFINSKAKLLRNQSHQFIGISNVHMAFRLLLNIRALCELQSDCFSIVTSTHSVSGPNRRRDWRSPSRWTSLYNCDQLIERIVYVYHNNNNFIYYWLSFDLAAFANWFLYFESVRVFVWLKTMLDNTGGIDAFAIIIFFFPYAVANYDICTSSSTSHV